MFEKKWSDRHVTDSLQNILAQIPYRASDRGLHVVDAQSIVMLALWSLVLWERKIGRMALERLGVDPFELARELDYLLQAKAAENPIAYDSQRQALVLVKTSEPYRHWDFDALLEPLIQQAEHEALDLGHNYVGSEHLLLAMVRLACPELSLLLEKHSVTRDRVKATVLDLLR